jgi:predicted ABC-type ATPase
MAKPQPPRVIIFAGPNGAGKSTHADAIVAALSINTFVNADYIARGLSGRHADAVAMQAGRIMLTRLKELAAAQQDFALNRRCPVAASRLFCVSSKRRGIKWRFFISR